jgi:hypothetical protein
MTRVWVNQPSTLQPDHRLHGKHGLVNLDERTDSREGDIVRVWFYYGGPQSSKVFASSLSVAGDDVRYAQLNGKAL